MNILAVLVPIALLLGLSGLAAFFWAVGGGQYDDLEGAALRILIDDGKPLPDGKSRNADRGDATFGPLAQPGSSPRPETRDIDSAPHGATRENRPGSGPGTARASSHEALPVSIP